MVTEWVYAVDWSIDITRPQEVHAPAEDVIGADAEVLVDLSLDPYVCLVVARRDDVVSQKL